MAEAVRVKKTKTKSHKSKTKDRQSFPELTEDVGIPDISAEAVHAKSVEFAENEETRLPDVATCSAAPSDELTAVESNANPVEETTTDILARDEVTICDNVLPMTVDLTRDEDTVDTKPKPAEILTHDICTDLASNLSEVPDPTKNLSPEQNFDLQAPQEPREMLTSGHLGTILAESFVNATAPEVIVSTEAVVAHGHLTQTSAVESNQPMALKSSQCERPAVAPVVVRRQLYPSLAEEKPEALRPFTDEQLRTLYYNYELEHIEDYIDVFLKTSQQERHEFHEVVLSYYRARNHLFSAERDLEILQKEAKKYQELAWDFSKQKIPVQGLCEDKYKVVGELISERAIFKDEAARHLNMKLEEIRNHITDHLSLYAYEVQMSRLQVDSYLSRLYSNNPALSDIPPNYPVHAYLAHQRDQAITHQVEALKACISVLFTFQRKPTKDDTFTKDVKQWLTLLVGTLLRLATLEDHLFLLNHVLRCPAGVAKWAVSFIQPVAPSVSTCETNWGGPLLDHFTTMLALILLPIRQREEMLNQLRVSHSPAAESVVKGQWVILDSDGEEDEDPSNSWHYLQENDVVSLLNQFPLYQIFDHILLIKDQNDVLMYDANRSSETSLLKLFAYATCLIRLFGRGLQNFTLGRYRQLNKRIGRMIRHIVQYTCDHWINFRSAYVGLLSSTMERLQLESDMVVQRAVECILFASRLGSWQFLTELPYAAVSTPTLWNLFRLMHHGCDKMTGSQITTNLTIELCKFELTDPTNQADFLSKLTHLQASETLFLLNTFANMARARTEDDREFIEFVSGEIHEIAYVSSHTREICSKSGRELLATICSRHPSVISFLLECTKSNMDKIGMVSHYLYRGLPVHLWCPTESDFTTLHHWLSHCGMNTAENQLARIIIEQLNWSFNAQGDGLFLGLCLHQRMATVLVDVTDVHLRGRNFDKLFIDGQKQLSPVGKMADDYQLATWIWGVALRLHLHPRSVTHAGSLLRDDISAEVVADLGVEIAWPIASGLLSESRIILASYFVLMMKHGHSSTEFFSDGVRHLSHLVEKSYLIPAIQCLYYITPMFFDCVTHLTSNTSFMNSMQMILKADSLRKGYFSFGTSCPVAQTFAAMIENQLATAVSDSKPVDRIIVFWLKILTALTNWNKEREIVYVIDNLVKSSFGYPEAFDLVQSLFLELTKSYTQEPDSGLLSSLASWLGGGGKIPSLMETTNGSEFVWFAFVVLVAETHHYETESNLWKELQQELLQNPSLTVDQALLKATSSLKISGNFTAASLGIYRWANQAIETPVNHPLLPIIWQQFMLAYLGRCVIASSLPQRGSVGDRFFSSSSNVSLMKRMKKRLKESADYYRHLLSKNASSSADASQRAALSPERVVLYENLYLTLSFWLDEPRLHDSALYVPALPEQYQGQLLIRVFQCQTEYWRHLVDTDSIHTELDSLSKEWANHLIQPQPNVKSEHGTRSIQDLGSMENLVSRLERHRSDDVIPPPPVKSHKSSIPDLSPTILLDQQNLLYSLRGDFNCMVDDAKFYVKQMSKQGQLDSTFLDFLKRLYVNVITEGVVTVPCRSTFNPTHRCKGPAVMRCQYENRNKDEIVSKKIDENRVAYGRLIKESFLTPPQNLCSAAVRVENAITSLVNLRHSVKDEPTRDQLIANGTALFYLMTSHISKDTDSYAPTRQFFTSCIELLGQEFIRNNPTQSQTLLRTILQSPSLVGLLAPNFCPNMNPERFVAMYKDMMNVPSCQGAEVAFTLLTKFDISNWLGSSRPVLSQRMTLIEGVIQALCLCGLEPDASMTLVFQVYRLHLQQLLRYQFPDHYGAILKLLLKGSSEARLCPSVWNDFLDCLDRKQRSKSLEGLSLYEKMLSTPCVLPALQIKECMEFLSSYFFKLRVSCDDSVTYGLYPKWSRYVKCLAQLMSHVSSDWIQGINRENPNYDKEQMISDAFHQILDLFTPWILPLDNNGQILHPWSVSDATLGSDMVTVWVDMVDLLHRTFEGVVPALSKNALSLLWSQYVKSFTIKALPEHLLSVVHDRLVLLPWVKLFPDLAAIELMVKVIDCSKSCFEFLGNIFTLLDWPSIVAFYCAHEPAEITTKLHVCLFSLLVHLGHETVIVENTNLPRILSSDIFDWNYLDGQNYQLVVQWFTDVSQPRCITLETTANGRQVLTLMKKAAGFYPNTTGAHQHPETPFKRCFFVRCIVQIICRASYLKDVRSEALGIVLNNLMTETESVIASISDLCSQHEDAVGLSTELLSLFNNCNPQGDVSGNLLQVALQWIESSPLSVMIMPVLTSACRCLASMTHMVVVIEACVDTHFSLDVTQTDGFGWTKILSILQVPDLTVNDFLKAAVQQGCYLTSYAFVLQKLPLSQSLSDELVRLNQLLEWCTNAKPSAENEAKLFLWWQKILELCQRQIDFGGDQRVVVKSFLTLTSSLTTLGEDKSSAGFFGAIGLGKKSSLSPRFRLVAKGLAAFLSAQIPSDLSLRLVSGAPGFIPARGTPSSPTWGASPVSPSQQALQSLAHLESLRVNRQYSGFKQHLELIISIVSDPRSSFRDSVPILTRIVSPLFPELFYLGAIHLFPV